MNGKKTNLKRVFKIGAYSVVLSAIALAIVIALNLLIGQLPTSMIHIDSTSEKIMTISSETKTVLGELDSDIVLYHVVTEGNEDAYITEMLSRYEEASSHIKVKKVDPVSRPTFTQQYTSETVSDNSIIAVSDSRNIVISPDSIYMYEISGYEGNYVSEAEYEYLAQMYQSYGYQMPSATPYFFAENAITGAIDYVRRPELPIMYCLNGHGETTLSGGNFGDICTSENVEIKELSMQAGETVEVPEDATSVVINIPTADITAEECDALKQYITNGGTVILTTSYQTYSAQTMPNLAALCSYMGLEAVEAPIVETDSGHYTTYVDNLLPDITGNGITSLMSSTNLYFYMPASHAVTAVDTDTAVETYSLLNTSSAAYAYSEENAEDESKAVKTQYSLAYQSVTVDDVNGEGGTLIWFASPYTFNDGYSQGTGNSFLFTAILQKTAGSTSISLIGKVLSSGTMNVTQKAVLGWIIETCIALPLIFVIFGLVLWIKRRKR